MPTAEADAAADVAAASGDELFEESGETEEPGDALAAATMSMRY